MICSYLIVFVNLALWGLFLLKDNKKRWVEISIFFCIALILSIVYILNPCSICIVIFGIEINIFYLLIQLLQITLCSLIAAGLKNINYKKLGIGITSSLFSFFITFFLLKNIFSLSSLELNDIGSYYYFTEIYYISILILGLILIIASSLFIVRVQEQRMFILMILLFSLTQALLIGLLCKNLSDSILNSREFTVYLSLIIILLFIELLAIAGIVYLIKKYMQQQQQLQQARLTAINKEFVENYNWTIDEILKLKHDLTNMIEASNGAFKDELIQRFSQIPKIYNTPITSVNAILTNKEKKIKELQIPYSFEINVKRDIDIDSLDLISLISNTLDNAIEASEQIEHPQINLKLEIDDRLYLSCNNKFDGKRINIKRKNSKYHGYGSKILKDITSKYKGNMDINVSTDIFLIEIEI